MKLLESFKEQIKSLGELKYAWFTSFNINIAFIETYVLPAVLEEEPPKNRLDYERLQLALNDSGIDFRVFCDQRYIDANQDKRTSVPVHGISTTNMEDFSESSLFHAKVIYLEDIHGNRIVGSGSANLTIDGWGRNQEVFAFYEIESHEQQGSVTSFFDALQENVGIEYKLRRFNGLSRDEETWQFVNSLEKRTFTECFFEKTLSNDLLIWSPYFSRDLASFIEALRSEVDKPNLNVHVVPDKVQGQYIRTEWNEKIQSMSKEGALAFYENPTSLNDNTELCHSKIWKLGGKLAVGSWNFTHRGTNLLDSMGGWRKESNIEAGFVIPDKGNWKNAVGKQILIQENLFADDEMLKEEELEVPPILSFDLLVEFDWHDQMYYLSGSWNQGELNNDYYLSLPGVKNSIQLKWKNKGNLELRSLFVEKTDDILINRRYDVIYDGKICASGLIVELNNEYRRAQAFASLSDFLNAHLIDEDAGNSNDLPFLAAIKERAEEYEGYSRSFDVVQEYSDISYFRLFQATHEIESKINSVTKVSELNRIIFQQPGSLLEFVEKAKTHIEKCNLNVFNWFLANEVDRLCQAALNVRAKNSRTVKKDVEHLSKERWGAININIPSLPDDLKSNKSYIKMVSRECDYV